MGTPHLLEAFLACPVKCHLLSEREAPAGTEYSVARRAQKSIPSRILAVRRLSAITGSLNADAMVLVQKQVGKQQTYVLSFRGQPVVQLSTKAWYAALERAGMADFRWHDLRHTRASWHVQNGTPLFALQELGGWESPEMVRRYARLGADHLAAYAERLCAGRAVAAPSDGTNPAQV